ncbi:hypothetical protein O6H91_13G091600 [Diphasiastrum complanatum]|uniref:Uncharacterized protein n=1 Tax=Diphasiastrum complanatum TaxID=34168 RepID=A0ACC2BXE3_DIPCM|nr:hypothetical protein O6H91_13G091600 [Diphasiastrum complanatum]
MEIPLRISASVDSSQFLKSEIKRNTAADKPADKPFTLLYPESASLSLGNSIPMAPASRKLPEEGTGSKRGPRSLLSLCIGCLGSHLEDIIDEMNVIALYLPADVKLKILAVARRRRVLQSKLLLALADGSWELLDVSGSEVTDDGMVEVAKLCPLLKVVDISHCSLLTSQSIQALIENCSSLQTLRCGGNSVSDAAARAALPYILPSLNREEAAESWEDLETKQVGKGAQVLRWLVWPSIDKKSRELLEVEGPRIVVNPKRSQYSYFQQSIPMEALPAVIVDEQIVKDIDPQSWAVISPIQSPIAPKHIHSGLSIAERFKLAFMQRDERLAPKRAKNFRQNQRRAEKVWLSSDTDAKALLWAGMIRKSMKKLDL